VLEPTLAEELGADLGVGGTADVEEEAPVVGLSRGVGVDRQTLAQTHGEQGAVQAVLEREPHAEIRRQAEGRDHLGSTDLVPVRQ
jgi:hypothetical protein